MLNVALKAIVDKLNVYLKSRFSLTKDKVELSPVLRSDGGGTSTNTEKITVTLVGINQEKNIKTPVINPADSPIYLNLNILISIYFGEEGSYEQALKELSAVISFFQANSVFTSQNTPELGNGIDKLVFVIEPQDMTTMQNMWSMLGGKHTPCILFKVTMVGIDEGNTSFGGTIGIGS